MGGFRAVPGLPRSVIPSHVRNNSSCDDSERAGSEHKLLISHKGLTLTKVNTYGLLYEWKGSDDSLKPLLLAAHQGLSPEHVDCIH